MIKILTFTTYARVSEFYRLKEKYAIDFKDFRPICKKREV